MNYTLTLKIKDEYEIKQGAEKLESEISDILLKMVGPALGIEIEGITVRKARG